MSSIGDQIKSAQASMATWPEWLKPEYTMQLDSRWARCDVCGQFIALKEFVNGSATRRLREPDSAFGAEKWDTHHNRCSSSQSSAGERSNGR